VVPGRRDLRLAIHGLELIAGYLRLLATRAR
jgi:hypothetical protein